MNDPPDSMDSSRSAERIREIVRQYLDALRRGERPDQEEWLARHSDLGADLAVALDRAAKLNRAEPGSSHGTHPDWASRATVAMPEPGSPSSGTPQGPAAGLTPVDQEFAIGLRCPHCGQPIQVALSGDSMITCSSCGSNFQFDSAVSAGGDEQAAPSRVGRFQIEDRLGRGGFGVVYKAMDPDLSRHVAIKMPRAGYFVTREDEQRFLREARSAARLRHPHIVRIHEIDRQHGVPFIVSEYIEGRTLADLLRQRRLAIQETVEITIQVAEALQYAHEQHVVHRDIKPSNILLDSDGRPYIADFGLARRDDTEITVTIDGQVLGTPAYMAPEQAMGDHSRVSARSDVYSLGVVLYHAFTGELPFRGSRRMLVRQVIQDDPRPPRRVNELVPPDLETITMKAMAKESLRRYASAQELADDLRRWQRSEPIHAKPVGRAERLWRWSRRNPVVASLSCAILLLLIGLSAGATIWAIRERQLSRTVVFQRDRARSSERNSLKRLVQLNVQNGVVELNRNDLFMSLPWFARALTVDDGASPASVEEHRIRLGTVIDQSPTMNRFWNCGAPVVHAEWTNDERRVAAAAQDGSLWVWEAASGERISPPMKHDAQLTAAAFDTKGTRAVTFSVENTALLWDLTTGKVLSKLPHAERPISGAFSPDGRWLATGSIGKTVSIWRADGGQLEARLEQPQGCAGWVRFYGDSNRLLTSAQNVQDSSGSMFIWDIAARQRIGLVMEHRGYIWQAIIDRQQTEIVSASEDGTIRRWNADRGTPIGTPLVHSGPVKQVQLTPDGHSILGITKAGSVAVWDNRTGLSRDVRFDHGSPVSDARLSPDGTLLATAGVDGRTRWWLWHSGREAGPPVRQGAYVSVVRFAADSRHLLVAGADATIRLWDLAGKMPASQELVHEKEITRCQFSPDGRQVLSTSRDATARLWDALSGKPLRKPLEHPNVVTDGWFTTDGQKIVTSSLDGVIRVWTVATGRRLDQDKMKQEDLTVRIALSPNGNQVAAADGSGAVDVWNLVTFDHLYRLPHARQVRSIAFSPDSRLIATASLDKTARLWSAENGVPVGDPLRHKGGVTRCRFSPNGRLLATCSEDHDVRLWDVNTGTLVVAPFHNRATQSAAVFHPDGHLLAGGGYAGQAWLRPIRSPNRPRWTRHRVGTSVRELDFSPDGRWLAIGYGTAKGKASKAMLDSAQIWSVATGSPVTPPLLHGAPLSKRATVNYIQFHPDGSALISGGDDGRVRVWFLPTRKEPGDQLMALVELLSSYTIDSQFNHVPVPAERLETIWSELKRSLPEMFNVTPEETIAWDRWKQAVRESNRPVAVNNLTDQ